MLYGHVYNVDQVLFQGRSLLAVVKQLIIAAKLTLKLHKQQNLCCHGILHLPACHIKGKHFSALNFNMKCCIIFN